MDRFLSAGFDSGDGVNDPTPQARFVARRLSVVIACLEEVVLISINLNEPVSIADDRWVNLKSSTMAPLSC